MRCARWEKLILLSEAGELTGRRVSALQRHLERCRGCREFAQGYRRAAAAIEKLPAAEPAPAALTRVRALLERRERPAVVRHLLPGVAVAAAAAAIIVAGLVVYMGRGEAPAPVATAVRADESSIIDDRLALLDRDIELLGDQVSVESPHVISLELDDVDKTLEELSSYLNDT